MTFLSESERAALKAQHKIERDKRVCDRIKAVLLYDKGWTYVQIAETLLLTEGAIRHHLAEYQSSRKLKPQSSGATEKLSANQAEILLNHLESHIYLYVKDIVSYVRSRWKISYTVPGMTDWLKRHGFSYKKPALVPGKANAADQEKWLEEYQKLKNSLMPSETICFIDGVHPTHNPQLAYGWIRKGKYKAVASNSGRSRINLSGSLDIISHKVVTQEDKTINKESAVAFFSKLEKAYPDKTKIYVFCDNASYYRNQTVSDYLKTSKIELCFLPPYSPNLNPIERLWKWMKETVVYNTYYEDFGEFRSAILSFFDILKTLDPSSELGCRFRKRIRDNFQIISSPL